MKHSGSLKSKNNGQIHLLEDRLFDRLHKNEEDEVKYDDLEFKMMDDAPDALSELIGRAKGLVKSV